MTKVLSSLRRTFGGIALALGSVLALSGAPAAAAPVLNTSLQVSGPLTAIYVFKSAADTSSLWLDGEYLFNNASTSFGLTVTLDASGPGLFELKNETMGYSFFAGVAEASDGKYYAGISSNFNDFGVGALSGAAQQAIDAAGGGFLFVGFEDRRSGDFDFNDLIFAFKTQDIVENTPAPRALDVQQVPEPTSLALFGLGLLGIFAVARRRL